MVSALIPRARELLLHMRQLSQLAADDPAARARARRAKRLLKVRSLRTPCTQPGQMRQCSLLIIASCTAAAALASCCYSSCGMGS
jgi:hypothetical protein